MRVLFAGLGSIGLRHLKNLKQLDCGAEFHILKDNPESMRAIDPCVSRVFFDVLEVDTDYDMIFIANPTRDHYKSFKELYPKGKAFFIEKPVFDEYDVDLSFMSSDLQKPCYVASPLKFHPVFKSLKKRCSDKHVLSVRAMCSSYLPDWRKDVDYRQCYSAHKSLGGGVHLDLIHEWDYITDILGFPETVTSFVDTISDLEIDSNDIALYIGKYHRGYAEIHLDYFGRSATRTIDVLMPDVTLTADFIRNVIVEKGVDQIIEPEDMYLNEIKYFLELVQGRAVNVNPVERALKVLRIARGEW